MKVLKIALCAAMLGLSACASQPTGATEAARSAATQSAEAKRQPRIAQVAVGLASWYGAKFQGRPTASGEPFDMNGMTAAHRTLPFGTRIRVVNPENGRTVVVRVNDRGPFSGHRIIDLSRSAAEAIGIKNRGVGQVKLEVLAGA